MDFVRLEPLANVSYITELVIWLLTLLVWVYTPGLIGVALEAGRQANPDSGAGYISPLGPHWLLPLLFSFLSSSLLAVAPGTGLRRLRHMRTVYSRSTCTAYTSWSHERARA